MYLILMVGVLAMAGTDKHAAMEWRRNNRALLNLLRGFCAFTWGILLLACIT
jgi:hypothetical protein